MKLEMNNIWYIFISLVFFSPTAIFRIWCMFEWIILYRIAINDCIEFYIQSYARLFNSGCFKFLYFYSSFFLFRSAFMMCMWLHHGHFYMFIILICYTRMFFCYYHNLLLSPSYTLAEELIYQFFVIERCPSIDSPFVVIFQQKASSKSCFIRRFIFFLQGLMFLRLLHCPKKIKNGRLLF